MLKEGNKFMDNARELRISNWVINEDDINVKITQVSIDIIHYEYISKKGHKIATGDGIENFKPIPLTEELLLKAGCEETIRGTWLTPIVNRNRARICKGENGLFYSYINEFRKIKLPYLHTLQNYMFILDGQELEINL